MHGTRCSQHPVPCHINNVLGDSVRYPNLSDSKKPKARIFPGFWSVSCHSLPVYAGLRIIPTQS